MVFSDGISKCGPNLDTLFHVEVSKSAPGIGISQHSRKVGYKNSKMFISLAYLLMYMYLSNSFVPGRLLLYILSEESNEGESQNLFRLIFGQNCGSQNN